MIREVRLLRYAGDSIFEIVMRTEVNKAMAR